MFDVEFLFDFGSFNVYLVWKVMQIMEVFKMAEIKMIFVLLGGIFKLIGNMLFMLVFGSVFVKMRYLGIEMECFQICYGIMDFQFNFNFLVNMLMLMCGCFVVIGEGYLDEYFVVGFYYIWEVGIKMDDLDIFVKVFNDVGLDGVYILVCSQELVIKKVLMDSIQVVVDCDVFGIFSFFVGDDFYFGKDMLWEIVEWVGQCCFFFC